MIYLAKGDCHLGIGETPAFFEENDNGSSIAIGTYNADTKKFEGSASIYGDWQAYEYLSEVLKKIDPQRTVNIPDFKIIFKKMLSDDINMCDYCDKLDCRDCPVKEWKEETEDVCDS